MSGPQVRAGAAIGRRPTFSDLGATVAEWLGGREFRGKGESFLAELDRMTRRSSRGGGRARASRLTRLIRGFDVGAALRAADGRVFVGCNVENAAYSGICAERSRR